MEKKITEMIMKEDSQLESESQITSKTQNYLSSISMDNYNIWNKDKLFVYSMRQNDKLQNRRYFHASDNSTARSVDWNM